MYRHQVHKGKIIAIVVLLVAGFVAYDYLTNSVFAQQPAPSVAQPGLPDSATPGVVPAGVSNTAVLDKASMALLQKIESIQFNKAVLTDPAFVSLEDRTVELAPEPTGRTNPFAPFGAVQTTNTNKTRR